MDVHNYIIDNSIKVSVFKEDGTFVNTFDSFAQAVKKLLLPNQISPKYYIDQLTPKRIPRTTNSRLLKNKVYIKSVKIKN